MFCLLISVKESSQLRPKTTRAILNYEGVNQNKPSSSPQKTCTPDDPCYIVNQIYGYVHLNGNVKLYKILTTAGVAQSVKALLRMRKVGC